MMIKCQSEAASFKKLSLFCRRYPSGRYDFVQNYIRSDSEECQGKFKFWVIKLHSLKGWCSDWWPKIQLCDFHSI